MPKPYNACITTTSTIITLTHRQKLKQELRRSPKLSTMTTHQKAIVIESRGIARLVSDAPIPRLRDDYVLVQNVAVAINPTDWQHIDGEG